MTNMQKYKLHNDVLLTDVDDEMVLLDMRSGQYYGLNTVGSEVLKLINEGKSLDDAKTEICQRYQIDKQTAHDDISELITELKQQNLLVTQE